MRPPRSPSPSGGVSLAFRRLDCRVHWVRPELVCEVAFLTWTDDGLLRQVSYQGIREDKKASEVRRPRASRSGPRPTIALMAELGERVPKTGAGDL
jgi:ATP-dependent DNA ligase